MGGVRIGRIVANRSHIENCLKAVGGTVLAADIDGSVADAAAVSADGGFESEDTGTGLNATGIEESEVVIGVVVSFVEAAGGGDKVERLSVSEAFGDHGVMGAGRVL